VLNITAAAATRVVTDLLCIPVCENESPSTATGIPELVERAVALPEFSGKKDETLLLYDVPETKARRILCAGMGESGKVDTETLRVLAGRAVARAIEMKLTRIHFVVPASGPLGISPADIVVALMEGARLANHIFDRYRKEKPAVPLSRIGFIVKKGATARLKPLAKKVEIICRATLAARDWVTTPSNDKRPDSLAADIARRARRCKLKTTVLDETALKRLRCGSLLSVAAGSSKPARMVVLEYRHPGAVEKLALVGKGVTFDTGGISLKPPAGMEDMKSDMAGAAAVAGAMLAIAELKPVLNVVAALPLVENMPSGSATRPGDIVTGFSGKTIEIGNTDAEGRLILVDAIAYLVKTRKPQAVIDLATLTGACVMALGERIAGLFSPDDRLADALLASACATHERCWRMPLPEDYREFMKSDTADIRNLSTTRYGGAITAALFISEFVEKTRWAHVDIAGPASLAKKGPYCGVGGTGFGVRLLCDLVSNWKPLA
jgi:leucyl aminopeptidase